MDGWRDFEIEREIAAALRLSRHLMQRRDLGLRGRILLRRGWRHRDFLYFFLGAFVGGGLVLDGALFPGRTGNAGALGSMPVMPLESGAGGPRN